MKISKTLITLFVIVGLLVLSFGWGFSTYNQLISQDETVSTSWSDLQAQYQRRCDLIPNLVKTVKAYATHESTTLTNVIAARNNATQIKIEAQDLTPQKMKEIQAAQGQLSTALSRLLMVTERYPELKANENFKELQAQLEGTENRIAESRRLYNQKVEGYNKVVRQIPTNIVASLCHFAPKSKFEASTQAQQAPTVDFDN